MTWTLDAVTPKLDAGLGTARLDGWSAISGVVTGEFIWSPSYATPKKVSISLWESKFGDGYQSRAGKGINNILRIWELAFNGRSEATAQAIEDFLELYSTGNSFLWMPPFLNPTNEKIKVICKEFQIVPDTYNSFNVTAVFTQVYGE